MLKLTFKLNFGPLNSSTALTDEKIKMFFMLVRVPMYVSINLFPNSFLE